METSMATELSDLVYALKDQTAQIECLGALVLALRAPLNIALEALEDEAKKDWTVGYGAGQAAFRISGTLSDEIRNTVRDNEDLVATVEELLKTQAAKE